MTAHLILSDGTCYDGRLLGAPGEAIGEVVFNTGMTGYQEILTDPSYAGQMVAFTYPLIGNYGINDYDFESDRIQPTGIIVKESCEAPSNWRSRHSLDKFLALKGITAIQGIDTRALTKRIRSAGVTMGIITTQKEGALGRLNSAQGYGDTDFVASVTTSQPYAYGRGGREDVNGDRQGWRSLVAVVDCGLKTNILRRLAAIGVKSVVYPAGTSVDQLMEFSPDGILLSPGPGDPARLGPVVETVRQLIGRRPMFGICLGNQLLCQAVGGRTFKLKFGHRGSNHPVKDLLDGSVTITSQNHGYAVDPASLAGTAAEVTQINVNDETVEGIQVPGQDAWSIQYHPEAAPGPWDSRRSFAQFLARMEAAR